MVTGNVNKIHLVLQKFKVPMSTTAFKDEENQ
jgi:hypothetical protein